MEINQETVGLIQLILVVLIGFSTGRLIMSIIKHRDEK